ncbi:hypothetical protein [Streptomyces sp. NPDC047706]|uniref:hypothetical protein n=1 Tax=Streptomyces sp. NPDC047706 TaxID=3365486 RepID=UPI00371570D8
MDHVPGPAGLSAGAGVSPRLGGRIATGDCPRLAAAFAEDPGPIDLEAVFERALQRVLGGFQGAVQPSFVPSCSS